MVSFYDIFMYPLEKNGIKKARSILIPKTKGKILEIGSGTGVNIKHYNFENIEELTMSDVVLSKKLKERTNGNINLLELDVEDLAYGGNGIARVEGFVVFVRSAIPGDPWPPPESPSGVHHGPAARIPADCESAIARGTSVTAVTGSKGTSRIRLLSMARTLKRTDPRSKKP